MSDQSPDATRVVTPEARASYPHVFTPKKFDDDKPAKYAIELVFPPGADLSAMKAAANAAIHEKWGDKPPKGLRSPFRDGEDSDYEPDSVFVRANSTTQPGVLVIRDGQKVPPTDAGDIYPGCFVRADLKARAYEHSGNKGVKFYLNNLLKTRDGERLDSSRSADDAFADVDAAAYGGGDDAAPYL